MASSAGTGIGAGPEPEPGTGVPEVEVVRTEIGMGAGIEGVVGQTEVGAVGFTMAHSSRPCKTIQHLGAQME